MFISDFKKPLRMLERLDEMARSFGVPTLSEQLDIDRVSVKETGDILLGSTPSSSFSRVIEGIARAASVSLDKLSRDAFAYVKGDINPVPFGDPDTFAFRFGEGYIAVTRDTCAFNARCDCISEDTSPLDLIILSCAIKVSQRDRYMLLRYNDKAMMANPAFAGGSYTDDSTGRGPGDMWKLFGGMLCELRSVIIDIEDREIASLPFYKFRNLGECEEYSLERVASAVAKAQRVEITDKMDGSFVQMKWMGEKCDTFGPSHRLTSMSGSLNPETNENLDFIYRWVEELEGRGMRYTDLCREHDDWTFIFEFVRPDLDSHIVQYDESRWGIYLLSARDIHTGNTMFHEELSALAKEFGVPMTARFDGYDLARVLDICHTADVSDREGFVVNADGWYIKVKLDEFCAISKLVHGSENFNTVIANVARGTFDDLIAKIPEVYRPPLIELAGELYAFDEQMCEYVDAMVASAPKGDMRAVAEFLTDACPKGFASLCIDAYKSGRGSTCYLYRNPRHPEPSCWKEKEFRARQETLRFEMQALSRNEVSLDD